MVGGSGRDGIDKEGVIRRDRLKVKSGERG